MLYSYGVTTFHELDIHYSQYRSVSIFHRHRDCDCSKLYLSVCVCVPLLRLKSQLLLVGFWWYMIAMLEPSSAWIVHWNFIKIGLLMMSLWRHSWLFCCCFFFQRDKVAKGKIIMLCQDCDTSDSDLDKLKRLFIGHRHGGVCVLWILLVTHVTVSNEDLFLFCCMCWFMKSS